jgi:hypothetical protein
MEMKNNLVLTLIFTLFFSFYTSGQDKTTLTKEQFSVLIDKLMIERETLNNDEENLKLSIDSLKIKLAQLTESFGSCRKTKLVKRFGKDIADRILKGQIWKGMTENMLSESWGKPDKIDTNKERWGVFSQWYYGNITYFFRDGSMIDWEETK